MVVVEVDKEVVRVSLLVVVVESNVAVDEAIHRVLVDGVVGMRGTMVVKDGMANTGVDAARFGVPRLFS